MQIEINGRTYQTHAGGSSTQSNRLIPISSNKMGEIFELSRGQYVNLQEIVKHGGDIAKARAEMSRRKDFKQSDFEEQQRFIMRLNSFDGYYNIDFETFPDIYILGEWIA